MPTSSENPKICYLLYSSSLNLVLPENKENIDKNLRKVLTHIRKNFPFVRQKIADRHFFTEQSAAARMLLRRFYFWKPFEIHAFFILFLPFLSYLLVLARLLCVI